MKKFFFAVLIILALALPAVSRAVVIDINGQTGPYLGLDYGAMTGLAPQDPRAITARILYTAFGLLGIIAVVLIVYAGFTWMTSMGNEEKAATAKKILYSAVIGLVIILSAYSITRFVINNLLEATTNVRSTE